MSADELKQLLDELSDCWRKRDAQGAAELFSEEAIYSEPPAHELRGRPAIAGFFRAFFASHYAIEFGFSRILIGEGEAAAEWSFSYSRTSDGARRRLAGIAFIDTTAGRIHVWRSFSARLE
ncbi:MAG TPA: nuclear transport factor 2 family protein [Ktedonobacterales bacterium]|nr:nuclear transport factor 2 family protein [Ktedonobacterales bacterium]